MEITESDHHLLIVRLNREKEGRIRKRGKKGQKGRWRREMWDEEGRGWFRNWVESLEMNVNNVEEEIKVMVDNLRGALN